jgi:hypothetical protein
MAPALASRPILAGKVGWDAGIRCLAPRKDTMLDALKRLLSPEYLVVAEPGPLGGLWLLYLALALFFAGGLGTAFWVLHRPGRQPKPAALRAWAWFEVWVCLAGLATVAGRFLGWPGWSARIWPYSLATLAVAGILAYRLRHLKVPGWLFEQFRIVTLGLSPGAESQPPLLAPKGVPGWFLFGLVVHLAGIGLVLEARYQLPAWLAPGLLAALLLPQAPVLLRRRIPRLVPLSPLLAAYAASLLWLLYRRLGITIVGWQGLTFPNPLVSLFYLNGIILAAAVLCVLCQLYVLSNELRKPALLWQGALAALLAATLTWTGVVYFGKRTHGATASDPYAYAQMAVDLAERGTFLHRFSLFQQVMPLGIAWAPLQPVGYHIPRNELGDCPSVWATGASVLLAAGYKLLGEAGLYTTTPFVALLALAVTWLLAQVVLQGESKPVRTLTGALAVTLLATSPEHVDRLLVPMADAPAQLFTLLALLFALRGMRELGERRRGLWSLFLAGLFFAWAYWVRHTQVVLAAPLILAIAIGSHQPGASHLTGRHPLPERREPSGFSPLTFLAPLLTLCGAALLAALPDIAYRWRTFGGPLATETTELHLMGLQHIGPVAWQMLHDSLAAGEWGYLFPLAIYGAYRLARDRHRESLVLGCAFLAVLLVNLTYRSLRLRDLISLFPLADLAVAYGAVALVCQVRAVLPGGKGATHLGAVLLPAVVLVWVVLSLALARWAMVDNLWKRGWASFGYMREENRAAFDRLAELTPPEAIIAASLNAGAITMYTGRDAIRPYDSWTPSEWEVFLEAMRAEGRPIFLLDDGGLMSEFIQEQKGTHRLTPIAELAVPLFYTQGRETGWLYRLEWDG